jgi:hypothetical protein
LPSWNDTPTKQAILDFLTSTSDEKNPDYIPPAERVAAFDNDGTLWVKPPAPAQTGLLLGKLVDRVKENPELATENPYKGIVTQDPVFLQGLAQQIPDTVIAFLKGVGKAWEGTTPEAYDAEVRAFLASSMHPRWDCPWTDLIYQPMLELFDLLREHDWRVFVCSGGGRDFMRVYSLESPFFFLPGNHDHYSEGGFKAWEERFGDPRGYYHIIYKDVLFLMINTEDPPKTVTKLQHDNPELYKRVGTNYALMHDIQNKEHQSAEDGKKLLELAEPTEEWLGDINISEDQVAYFKEIIEAYPDVRWTFCVTHSPPYYSPAVEKDPGNFARISRPCW